MKWVVVVDGTGIRVSEVEKETGAEVNEREFTTVLDASLELEVLMDDAAEEEGLVLGLFKGPERPDKRGFKTSAPAFRFGVRSGCRKLARVTEAGWCDERESEAAASEAGSVSEGDGARL